MLRHEPHRFLYVSAEKGDDRRPKSDDLGQQRKREPGKEDETDGQYVLFGRLGIDHTSS